MDNNPAGDGFSPNTSAPEPTPTPVTEPTVPIAEPTPILSSEPVTKPAATPVTEPATTAEPAPVLSSEPAAEPAPILSSEPTAEPVSVLTSAPATEPKPALTTEPATQSVLAGRPTTPDASVQPAAAAPAPTAKSSKKPLIFALIGVLVAAAAAVIVVVLMNMGGKGGSNIDTSNPEVVAKAYAQNLLDKKLDENFELLSLPENHFLTSSDYKDFISKNIARKSEAGVEAKVKEAEESLLTDKNASYNVLAEKEKDGSAIIISVNLLQKDNKWGVEENNFYITDWAMAVPGGTKITVDGKEVPESYIKDDSSITKTFVKYVFPAIYSNKKEFKLEHELDSKTIELTPLMSESGKEYDIELNNKELITKAQNYIKETWNAIYKDYEAGTDVSDVAKKYFDDTMSIETVNKYYKDGIKSLRTAVAKPYTNYTITEIVTGKDSCYILDKDIITINFGYRLNWVWSYNNDTEDMSRYSKIRLRIDGDSFKIYEVPDEKLFSWSNDFTKEF